MWGFKHRTPGTPISSPNAAPLYTLQTIRICSASPVSNVRHMPKKLWQLSCFISQSRKCTALAREKTQRKMNLCPLSFAIHFSFWSVPKTEFTRLEFYTIVLFSALFSTRPSPPFPPIGSLAPNQTTLKCPGPSSKAPTFPRDFPAFPDFPKSQLCKECVTPGGALTASIVLAPPPRLLKFIWSMLLFACFLTWGLRVLQCHFFSLL